MKRVITIITTLFLFCNINSTVFADGIDFANKGSIKITVKSEENYVTGGDFTIYKIGEINKNSYSFELSGVFKNCGESLENIQDSSLAERLSTYAKENTTGVNQEVGENATVTFDNLELGLYLVVQNKAADGYSKISPFLVSVPIEQNGEYVYSVDASPKIQLEPTTPPDTPPDNPSTPPSNPPTSPDNAPDLPQTGQLNWPIPVLAVSGLVLLTMGWVLRFGRKKGSNEE